MFRIAVLLLMVLTTACSSSLVQLRKVEPKGNLFQIYLAREYLDYAEAEADQYDWFDSTHFSRKGLKAAKGMDTYPEDLRDWDIPVGALPTLIQARESMMTVLASGASVNNPKQAAKMQFYFDCWVEQEEENWQVGHTVYCREHFYNVLDELYAKTIDQTPVYEAAVDLMVTQKAPDANMMAPMDMPIISPEVEMEMSEAMVACPEGCYRQREKRTVYFEFNNSKLTKRTQRVLSNIISEMRDVEKYEITINGYADSIGSEDYNLKLSKKRAQSVKRAFLNAGFDEASMTIFAFGEARGLLDTQDNVPEKENRAVEIVIEM